VDKWIAETVYATKVAKIKESRAINLFGER
jgi:hypothetical protein